MYGTVSLYQNLRTRRVLIQRFTKHPIGAEADVGTPVELEEAELASRLVPEVLAAIDAYGKERYDEAAAIALAEARGKKFHREHANVSILRDENGVLTITPTTRVRGGAIGFSKDHIVLQSEEVASQLFSSVMHALAKASSPGLFKARSRTRDG